jgi:hypothetical protein
MVAAASLLGLAPAAGWAQGSPSILQVLAESADTRAAHQALARYYRAQAADATQAAEDHRAMSRAFQGKPGAVVNMRKHCDQIVKMNEDLAAQYNGLAKEHEAAAGK